MAENRIESLANVVLQVLLAYLLTDVVLLSVQPAIAYR